MPITAIVILNYNGIDFLKKYLSTLIKNSDKHEIIIADNGSTDSSLDWLDKNHSEIRTITLKIKKHKEFFQIVRNLILQQIGQI